MIELNIDAMAIDVDAPTQEMIDKGANPLVVCQVVGGSELPFANPNNPNTPMRFPSMTVSFSMDKETAEQYIKLLQEKVDQLPDKTASSKLTIAHSIQDADKVVDFQKHLTKR